MYLLLVVLNVLDPYGFWTVRCRGVVVVTGGQWLQAPQGATTQSPGQGSTQTLAAAGTSSWSQRESSTLVASPPSPAALNTHLG